MRIALLFNERPPQVPLPVPDDMFEEYDSIETVRAIARALGKLGAAVDLIHADHDLVNRLRAGNYDMAFNIAEGPVNLVGRARRCREALPVAACETAGVPYTGSDLLTLALTLDKSLTRRVVSTEIPVAPAVLFGAPESADPEDEVRDAREIDALAKLEFPVLVKPNDEGSSKGIRQSCVCQDQWSALALVRELRNTYGCAVLVEEFLPGAEVTVAITGNGSGTRVLGMMEIAPREPAEPFVYSVEVKRNYRQQVSYHVPPRVSLHILEQIETRALIAYRLLGCQDFARMDFRLDRHGQPCFLECNALPGLNPEDSDIVILSRGVLSYDSLVQGILIAAAERTGITVPAATGVV